MEQGTTVYLCEDLFCKFRELFDWMKSSDNWMKEKVVSKNIKNKFTLICSFSNTAVISVFDDVLDQDLEDSVPCGKMDQFTILHEYFSKINTTITKTDILFFSLLAKSENLMNFKPVKRKSFIFEVPSDKLSKIGGL